jgi:hypothetical protein
MSTLETLLADRWLTREQIAIECGVSTQKISALVQEHQLPRKVQPKDRRVKLYSLKALQELLGVMEDVAV